MFCVVDMKAVATVIPGRGATTMQVGWPLVLTALLLHPQVRAILLWQF